MGDVGRKLGFVAAALTVVGSLAPWATVETGFGTISKAGTDGDGVVTLVAGLLLAGAAWWGKWVPVGLLGFAIGAVAVVDIMDVVNTRSVAKIYVGVGLYLVAVGAALALVATGLLFFGSQEDEPTGSS